MATTTQDAQRVLPVASRWRPVAGYRTALGTALVQATTETVVRDLLSEQGEVPGPVVYVVHVYPAGGRARTELHGSRHAALAAAAEALALGRPVGAAR